VLACSWSMSYVRSERDKRMSAEGFDKLVDEIGATKYDLATKLIADRRR
jgi:hypothetical protein